MATKISQLITVCLPFHKVKLQGEWFHLSEALANEIRELRKEPMVWIATLNIKCSECNYLRECRNIKN